ncbi:cytochrome P450 [Dactylosporangium sp. McL0621]|uniref:cytochrome P450 n=1 Tax=Dactylosporangium sp. McL0621 TaxID=3415678 RepID=UPI003CEBFCD0
MLTLSDSELALDTARGPVAALLTRPSADVDRNAAVVLCAGVVGSKEDFVPVLPALAEAGYHAYAYDYRGHYAQVDGESPEAHTIARHAEDLVAVLESVGRPVHLVGHSYGGFVARAAALARPELLLSVTLIGAGPGMDGAKHRRLLSGFDATLALQGAGVMWPVVRRLVPERDTDRREFWSRRLAGMRLAFLHGALRRSPPRPTAAPTCGPRGCRCCSCTGTATSASGPPGTSPATPSGSGPSSRSSRTPRTAPTWSSRSARPGRCCASSPAPSAATPSGSSSTWSGRGRSPTRTPTTAPCATVPPCCASSCPARPPPWCSPGTPTWPGCCRSPSSPAPARTRPGSPRTGATCGSSAACTSPSAGARAPCTASCAPRWPAGSRRAEELREHTVATAEACLDRLGERFAGGAVVNLAEALAIPFASLVTGRLLDIPDADALRLGEAARVASAAFEPFMTPRQRTEMAGAGDEIIDALEALAAEREAGLLPVVRRLRPDLGEQYLGDLALLFGAGYDSPASLVTLGARLLLSYPDEAALLGGGDDAAAERAVEEILRYEPPVQVVVRIATAAARFGDVEITPGMAVLGLVGAANRDPAYVPNPDRFDVLRRPTRASLSFGAGRHFCPGAALARQHAQVLFPRLLRQYPTLRIAGPVRYRAPRTMLRGIEDLPVTVGA